MSTIMPTVGREWIGARVWVVAPWKLADDDQVLRVDALLKMIENGEARLPPEERVDLSSFCRRLGLSPW